MGGKTPCAFCRQSRWVLVITMLLIMAAVLFLQQPAG